MASDEASQDQAETAQTISRIHVVVTGAGFTRALAPGAPLLVDDFNNDALEDKVRGLPNASRLLDWERNPHPQGHIDIERLMTRLDALMPYDYAEEVGNAANEYGFLLSELKRAFLDRIHEARKGQVHGDELKRFVKFCERNHCCCITFNYDDFLDEALAQTASWSPYWGYGFFCPSSQDTIASSEGLEQNSPLQLLKLHGSINWRPKLGYASPVAVDSITHHHVWPGTRLRFPVVRLQELAISTPADTSPNRTKFRMMPCRTSQAGRDRVRPSASHDRGKEHCSPGLALRETPSP